MPKKTGEKRNVRTVRRGDVVETLDGGEEVVRSVQVVLQLANGVSVPYESTAEVRVLPPEELPDMTEASTI